MKKINFEEWKLITAVGLFVFGLFINSISIVSNILIILSYFIVGYEVLIRSFKSLLKGMLFDESFLMTLATVGAFFIGEVKEAATVMILFQIGEYLEEKAISKSRNSISELMELKCDRALLKKGKEELFVSLENVKKK